MASTTATGDGDAFTDPSVPLIAADAPPNASEPQKPITVPDSLAVGGDSSLTLGTDDLTIVDEAFADVKGANCCGLPLAGKNKAARSIPFYNILWAELSEKDHVTIQYAQTVSNKSVRPSTISYTIDKPNHQLIQAWIERLLDRAYGASRRQKRIKVLVNPFGGQGGAVKMYDKQIAPIFAAARCVLDVEKTTHNGHAVEVAQNLDIDAFDVVACCSGDGIPHEVWNGLGKRPDAARALAKMAVTQLPCGSGNAMSMNFNGTNDPSLAALAIVKGLRTPLDLSSVTQGGRRTLSFLSQALGLVAESDLATEHLRWMGSARFTWGALVRLLNKTVYPADIAVKVEYDTKEAIRQVYRAECAKKPANNEEGALPAPDAGLPPLKYGTASDPLPEGWQLIPHDKMGNFYAGNIAYMSADANFFPGALPCDGCLDLVRIRGDLSRPTAIKTLLAIENDKFFDLEHVDYQKVSAYRIIPRDQKDGYISIDGERVPFEGFQVEVHKGLGRTLSKSGHLCEAKGV